MPIYSIFLLWTTKWSHVLLVTTDKHEKSKKSKLNYQRWGFFYTTLTLCWHLGAYQVVSIQKKNLFLTNKGGGGVDSPERLLLLPDQFFCLNFLEYAVMSSNINIIFSDWLTFDGIHPTFKQVPPNDFSFSTQTVCKTKELPYLPVYNAHFFFHKNKHQNRGAYYTRILLFVKHVLICIR